MNTIGALSNPNNECLEIMQKTYRTTVVIRPFTVSFAGYYQRLWTIDLGGNEGMLGPKLLFLILVPTSLMIKGSSMKIFNSYLRYFDVPIRSKDSHWF